MIPSYDDLTPGISDVHPRDTFNDAARVIPRSDEPVVSLAAVSQDVQSRALFAGLRPQGPARPGALMALARDFSPRIESCADGCVVLDVSGLGRLLGDAPGIAAELERTAGERGIKVRMALASTHTSARLLTHHPSEHPLVAIDGAAALASVRLETFASVQGAGDAATSKMFDTLRRWGLRTLGEFAALPPDDIAARFGQRGVVLQRLARGIDPRPLIPDPGVPRFVQSMELEWPIETLEPLSFVFARLLEPLAVALERADKAGAALRLDLRLVDRSMHARVLELPAPMRDPRVLRTLLLLDLESHPPSAGIDVVTIEIDPAPSRIVQFSLLERAVPSPETLATLTARLNALVGEERCGSPVLLDSHRPDAFVMGRFGASDACLRVRTGSKEFQGVLGSSLVLRRFRPPVAVRVMVERGRPAHVAIGRKGVPGGRVEQAAGPWRTSGAWWNATGEHWNRDEWDVALSDGSVCRLYCDRDSGVWFVEGLMD